MDGTKRIRRQKDQSISGTGGEARTAAVEGCYDNNPRFGCSLGVMHQDASPLEIETALSGKVSHGLDARARSRKRQWKSCKPPFYEMRPVFCGTVLGSQETRPLTAESYRGNTIGPWTHVYPTLQSDIDQTETVQGETCTFVDQSLPSFHLAPQAAGSLSSDQDFFALLPSSNHKQNLTESNLPTEYTNPGNLAFIAAVAGRCEAHAMDSATPPQVIPRSTPRPPTSIDQESMVSSIFSPPGTLQGGHVLDSQAALLAHPMETFPIPNNSDALHTASDVSWEALPPSLGYQAFAPGLRLSAGGIDMSSEPWMNGPAPPGMRNDPRIDIAIPKTIFTEYLSPAAFRHRRLYFGTLCNVLENAPNGRLEVKQILERLEAKRTTEMMKDPAWTLHAKYMLMTDKVSFLVGTTWMIR